MRPIHYLTSLLLVALVGATALAWRQWQELAVLRATADDGERAALEAKLAEFMRRNLELQTALTALQSGKGEGAEDEKPEGDAKSAAKGETAVAMLTAGRKGRDANAKKDDDLETLAALADLPEFQKLLALQLRGKVDEKYAGVFKRLKLSPEELTRLQTLLAERQGAFGDALLAAREQGLSGKEARQVAADVAKATQKQLTNDIKELLGPQRFNQLQNYERTAPQRETVAQLASRLSYTDSPLTGFQQEQLAQVLASSGTPKVDANGAPIVNKKGAQVTERVGPVAPLPGSAGVLGINSTHTVAISESALGAAKTFLAPEQVAALQRMQQEQQAQQAFGSLVRGGNTKNQSKSKPPKR